MMKSCEEKLVEFFRSPEGAEMASEGDAAGWDPAECAIENLKRLHHYQKVFRDALRVSSAATPPWPFPR